MGNGELYNTAFGLYSTIAKDSLIILACKNRLEMIHFLKCRLFKHNLACVQFIGF